MIEHWIFPRSLREGLTKAGFSARAPGVVGRQVGLLRVVAALSTLVPFLLLGMVAWQTWNMEREELKSQVTKTLSILLEDAEKVSAIQELALDWVDDRTKHLSWAEIEASRDFFQFAKTLTDKSGYIDSIFLVDDEGIVRATSSRFPMDRVLSVADRDYFLDAKRDPVSVHFSEPVKGRLSGNLAFRIARGRLSADGVFAGVLVVSFSPAYFEKFFANIGGPASGLICLTRNDGKLLVSNTKGDLGETPPREHPCAILMRNGNVGQGVFVSKFNGREWLGEKRQLRAYPIALSYAVDMRSIRHEWLQDLVLIGAVAVVSSLVLFALSFVALRIAQGEQRAIERWQDEVKERERVEGELRQASKMEALGRMASGVAHHFNNLLPAMSGLLDQTRREVPPQSAIAKRLERILDAVAQGRQLVRSILLFSRRQVSSHEPVAIATLVEDTLAMVQDSLPRNVRVLTRLDCRGEVVADRAQLQEVLMNLITNAVHAIGPKDGMIELATEPVMIDSDAALKMHVKSGSFVRVLCRDDGAGMSRDVIEHAFDPFFTTKPADEGTGLGLAIVHGIVTGLGGSIRVDSILGSGSSFALFLPLRASTSLGASTT